MIMVTGDKPDRGGTAVITGQARPSRALLAPRVKAVTATMPGLEPKPRSTLSFARLEHSRPHSTRPVQFKAINYIIEIYGPLTACRPCTLAKNTFKALAVTLVTRLESCASWGVVTAVTDVTVDVARSETNCRCRRSTIGHWHIG